MKRLIADIDDQTHAQFKAKAAGDGLTMKEVITAAIGDYLNGKYRPKIAKPSKGQGDKTISK